MGKLLADNFAGDLICHFRAVNLEQKTVDPGTHLVGSQATRNS